MPQPASLASGVDRESFERCAAQPVFQEIFGATKRVVDIDHHRCAVISIGEAPSTAR
ncbi:hypothetical protein [Streptomyces sp. NPDC060275]|uniref:hypothetical protein n=1 Tax=Streptomyces sp. NPDC060275 TaxID=3347090 RepID=UPI003667D0D6